jgi:hypothetical protein
VVSGCANNGSGLVRLTTSTAHELKAGDVVVVGGVGGVTGANGRFTIAAAPTSTTLDLASSAFSGSYTSGGSVNPAPNHRRGKGCHIEPREHPENGAFIVIRRDTRRIVPGIVPGFCDART